MPIYPGVFFPVAFSGAPAVLPPVQFVRKAMFTGGEDRGRSVVFVYGYAFGRNFTETWISVCLGDAAIAACFQGQNTRGYRRISVCAATTGTLGFERILGQLAIPSTFWSHPV
jgi:hypothetical protein